MNRVRGARPGRRLAAGVLLATVAAAGALVAGALPVRAASEARERAAAAMRARVGPAVGATADRDAVLAAWEAAGARLDGVRRHLAANAHPGAIDGATLLFGDLCGPDLAPPRDVSEPGDLLLYREPPAVGARWRVGMLTGSTAAVIIAPGARRLEEVRRSLLLDDVSSDLGPRPATPGTLRLCRFSAGLLPGGGGGAPAAGARRITLLDAPEAVRALQWELDHPRDADTGAVHRLGRVVLTPLALVAAGASIVLGGAGRLTGALIENSGSPPAVALWHLLGSSFDGRLLHEALTETLVAAVLGPDRLLLGRFAATAWMLGPVHGAASFAVSVLTGVDDSRHVVVGGVLLALVCDLLVVAKPFAVLGRLGAGAAGELSGVRPGTAVLRRTLDLSSRAGDLVSGKPSALLRLGGTVPRRRLHDVLDTASLLVRPTSVPGHVVDACGRLARWGRTATAASTPGGDALAAAVQHLGAEELRQIERLADLSHLHSGARTLTAVLAGDLHPFATDPPPPPPIELPVPDR